MDEDLSKLLNENVYLNFLNKKAGDIISIARQYNEYEKEREQKLKDIDAEGLKNIDFIFNGIELLSNEFCDVLFNAHKISGTKESLTKMIEDDFEALIKDVKKDAPDYKNVINDLDSLKKELIEKAKLSLYYAKVFPGTFLFNDYRKPDNKMFTI